MPVYMLNSNKLVVALLKPGFYKVKIISPSIMVPYFMLSVNEH